MFQVAASDAATAVLTGRGEVWVLHEFQCRSVASRYTESSKKPQ